MSVDKAKSTSTDLRILTWNIGSVFFLKYTKYFNCTFKKQRIKNEYFQPILNGEYISNYIQTIQPDVVCLQEIFKPEDTQKIKVLEQYPYQKLISTWYHPHSILIATKIPFKVHQQNGIFVIQCESFSIIPIHLNSFSAKKRLGYVQILAENMLSKKNIILLGDTNFWNIKNFFLFQNDKKAYRKITELLVDTMHRVQSTSIISSSFDKIFVSKNIKIANTHIESSSYLMDHYPVYSDISI